jgi:hypothetical protein
MLLFDMMLGKVKNEYILGMRNYGKPNSYNSTLYLIITRLHGSHPNFSFQKL